MTSTTPSTPANKYRTAMEVLQRSRDQMVEEMADLVIEQAADFLEGGYLFNEFLEGQGTKLHFLGLLLAQLEQSAEQLEEAAATRVASHPTTTPKPKRKSRPKKLPEQSSCENEPGET
jgi:hypothetical protein